MPVRMKTGALCHDKRILMCVEGDRRGCGLDLSHRLMRGGVFELEERTKLSSERAVLVPGTENEDIDGEQGGEKEQAHKERAVRMWSPNFHSRWLGADTQAPLRRYHEGGARCKSGCNVPHGRKRRRA